MRDTIRALPNGVYRGDGLSSTASASIPMPLPIVATVTVAGRHHRHRLRRHAPIRSRPAINCPISLPESAAFCAIRCLSQQDIPNCEGYLRPITVRAPEGCLVNPRYPAACGARGVVGYRVFDAIMQALAQVVPERAIGGSEGGPYLLAAGGMHEGRPFVLNEMVVGTWGARAGKDGIEGISNPAANLSNQPIEMIEADMPVEVLRYGLVPDSGGAGDNFAAGSPSCASSASSRRRASRSRGDRRDHPPYRHRGRRHRRALGASPHPGGRHASASCRPCRWRASTPGPATSSASPAPAAAAMAMPLPRDPRRVADRRAGGQGHDRGRAARLWRRHRRDGAASIEAATQRSARELEERAMSALPLRRRGAQPAGSSAQPAAARGWKRRRRCSTSTCSSATSRCWPRPAATRGIAVRPACQIAQMRRDRAAPDGGRRLGICCAKPGELLALFAGRHPRPDADRADRQRRARSTRSRAQRRPARGCGVVADRPTWWRPMARRRARHGTRLDVLVDLDVGPEAQRRRMPAGGRGAGPRRRGAAGPRYVGVQAYQGRVQHIDDFAARARRQRRG